MNKCLCVLVDSFLLFLLWLLIMIYSFSIFSQNCLFLIIGLFASFYYLPKSLTFILLIIDAIKGTKTINGKLVDTLQETSLEFLFKKKYTIVYLQNNKEVQNFVLFSEDRPNNMLINGMWEIIYYPRTKIILQIKNV